MKTLFSILLACCALSITNAQGVCSGNLGENIFTRGDFGSGQDAVLLNDPEIAAGYNYSTAVPFDGSYSICSRSSALQGLFPTWLQVTDNSDDPNGYFMVVNADYTPGIFYEETVDGLCENTLYEFSADIINMIKTGVNDHRDPNVTFLIDDVQQFSTGNIPKTQQWEQYGFSFVTTANQSSIKLTLRNNAPGGIGNDLGLDNISFRACGPSSFIGIENEENTIFLCKDDDPLTVVADIAGSDGNDFSILWQSSLDGETWTDIANGGESSIIHTDFDLGDYYYRYLSSGNEINLQNPKCRIISDILIITILPDTYEVSETFCDGQVYEFGTQSLTTDGIYTEGFVSRFGCDSTVILDISFEAPLPFVYDVEATDPSCYGFSDGSILINQVTGGNGGITYQLFDEDGNTDNFIYDDGDYSIVAIDQYGCPDTYDIILTQPDQITTNIGRDTSIKLGADLNFNPEHSVDFASHQWTGNGLFDCLDCPSVNYLPFQSSQVSLQVVDDNDCITNDSIFVTIDADNLVHLPNVFSPNDDRINDHMTINFFGRSVATIASFKVYDRLGGLVHELQGVAPTSGIPIWDGYISNTPVSTAVYSYVLEVIYINGAVQQILGSITVIRD